jgi:hypothetical protein
VNGAETARFTNCCKPLPQNLFARSRQVAKGWGEGNNLTILAKALQLVPALVLQLLPQRMRALPKLFRARGMQPGLRLAVTTICTDEYIDQFSVHPSEIR